MNIRTEYQKCLAKKGDSEDILEHHKLVGPAPASHSSCFANGAIAVLPLKPGNFLQNRKISQFVKIGESNFVPLVANMFLPAMSFSPVVGGKQKCKKYW